MATYRALHGFSLGESRGDVASGATLTEGVDISSEEVAPLQSAGHISLPTTNNTPLSFSSWCAMRVAESSVPLEWIEVIQGFTVASGTDSEVGNVALIDAELGDVWIDTGKVTTAQAHDVSVTCSANGGLNYSGEDTLQMGAFVRVTTVPYMGSISFDCIADGGYEIGEITLDAVPVSPVGTVYTLTSIVATHAIVVTFSAV